MLDNHIYVVFGATGDLMKRKLLPALHDMLIKQKRSQKFVVLGVSRRPLSDEAYRSMAQEAMLAHGYSETEAKEWCASNLFFQSVPEQSEAAFDALRTRIEALEEQFDLPGNRVFYLSLPPRAFKGTIELLGTCGLNSSPGWTRIVIEKPFGRDYASGKDLNAFVHQYFTEDQVYRIDHYLGKESVQNLLVFRFGNAIFESLWNRDHIERVDIVVNESLGVGTRAGYYDQSGALRDMVQNHLTQLFTLVAMEPPASVEANAIRYEKIKVLKSTRPLSERDAVFAQYDTGDINGETVPAYREEANIPPESTTPTYVGLRLFVDNWRWQGVPFVLQTGKRMKERLTRIVITFRRPPISLFHGHSECRLDSNVLHMTLQPDEGFSLGFEVKRPGSGYSVATHDLRFQYQDAFGALPDAYRTLLEDVVRGDPTLFVHAEEVEEAWKLYTPLLENEHPLHFYEPGSWGPKASYKMTRMNTIYG